MKRLEKFKLNTKYPNLNLWTPTEIPEPKLNPKSPKLDSRNSKVEKITDRILKDSEYSKEDWLMVSRMVAEIEKIGQ